MLIRQRVFFAANLAGSTFLSPPFHRLPSQVVRALSEKGRNRPRGAKAVTPTAKEDRVASEAPQSLLDKEYEQIAQRVEIYKRELRRHTVSSFKSREISSSVAGLQLVMADATRKRAEANMANTIANIPAYVTIEVLSNGTTQMLPCVVIRTPLKTYLFNCPEGTSRFLTSLRLKPQNICDIFITRGVWDNIGGISSILLSKESNAMTTRLHGAMNVKHFLECIRPFQDSDFGSVKYPSQVEERTLETADTYEDSGLIVHYIPLLSAPSPPSSTSLSGPVLQRRRQTDTAFLIELKEPSRKIDPTKLISMEVPKGPLIGKLKNGEAITLPDGRVIRPDDVYSNNSSGEELPRALIVECDCEGQIDALAANVLLKGIAESPGIDYVVHLSEQRLLELPSYRTWASSLGKNTRHLIVNGSGPVVPGGENSFRHSRLLKRLRPEIFEELRPRGWRGVVTQERDLGMVEAGSDWLLPAPLQRFWMRKAGKEEPVIVDLKEGVEFEGFGDAIENSLSKANQVSSTILTARTESSVFPRISFLGTSSAVPSKYRNVSGYLMETSSDSAILVDVGESTYGQLRALLDDDECRRMLLNLRAVFITHAHQDHMNGLYTVIERRLEVFKAMGVPYRKMVLACNRNVVKPLRTYSSSFVDIEKLVHIIDVLTCQPTTTHSGNGGSRSPTKQDVFAPPVSDLLSSLPADVYTPHDWKMDSATAVQVHHTRQANAFVFSTNDKKVVFSGDTMPCDLLVEQGKGADVLIHEATFEDGHETDARRKKHSTMRQAVTIGQRMGAKHTILSHFSARYPKVPPLPEYLEEARVGLAMDCMRVPFDCLPLLPLLIPTYRLLFHEDLFEIELKTSQRDLRNMREAETGEKEEQKKGKNNNPKRVAAPVDSDTEKKMKLAA